MIMDIMKNNNDSGTQSISACILPVTLPLITRARFRCFCLRFRRISQLSTCMLAAGLFLASGPSHSADFYWNALTGQYETLSNWTTCPPGSCEPIAFPGSIDNIFFPVAEQ